MHYKIKNSYGFILLKIVNRELKILLVQRKFSLSFQEFILGKYKLYDFQRIEKMFKTMTISEKELIKDKSFNELWNSIWSFSDEMNKIEAIQKKKEISNNRYTVLYDSDTFSNLNYLTNTESIFDEPEYTFPKGRKNSGESSFAAAVREVKEETELELGQDYVHLTNIKPLSERYIGNDSHLYRNTYFIGLIISDKNVFSNNEYQKTEVGKIDLFNVCECLKLMRCNARRKERILSQLIQLLKEKYNEIVQGIVIK